MRPKFHNHKTRNPWPGQRKKKFLDIKGHCVFYGVESWSKVLEWHIGVASNFGVANRLVLCELTA